MKGKDASAAFHDAKHTQKAITQMNAYKVDSSLVDPITLKYLHKPSLWSRMIAIIKHDNKNF